MGDCTLPTRKQPYNHHFTSYIKATLAEAIAAFCRKARAQDFSQRISEAERDQNIELFRRDAQRQYNLVRVTSTIYTQAGDLCRFHRLRAYDAVQLACALEVRKTLTALGIAPSFVSSDADLLSIAQAAGLRVENPNDYS